jgi:threonine dehydratase
LLGSDLAPGVLVKAESLQVTGSFKARGACNAVLCLLEREPAVAGVVTHSSGNHAQAVAWAARIAGLPATIVIPASANPAKIAATRAFGADVITDGVTYDNRERIAEEISRARGLHLLHPYDDWDVIHGAATVGVEIVADAPAAGAVVVPVGGGGQLAGIALAFATAAGTDAVLYGVEPETAADAALSLKNGRLEHLDADPVTIADGVKSKQIGDRNYEVIVSRRLVKDIVTVSEDEIAEAVRVAWQTLGLALEPTGALSLAAYLSRRVPPGTSTRPTVLSASGGNFDPATVAGFLAPR